MVETVEEEWEVAEGSVTGREVVEGSVMEMGW